MAEKKKISKLGKFNAPSKLSAKDVRQFQNVRDDPDKYGVEKCCVRDFWAVVERDGTLVRGRNVLRTRKVGTGQYEVFFTGDVREGVYVATIGRPGIFTEPSGQIGVALRYPGTPQYMPFEDNNGVWVDTQDSSGKSSDRAFHLVVHTQ